MTRWNTTLTLLLTLVFCVFGKDDSCGWMKRFEVQECMQHGGMIESSHLLEPSYGQQMCRENQPVVECLKQHLEECPNLAVFQALQGQVVSEFFASINQLCEGGTDTGASGSCSGSLNDFKNEMSKCDEPVMMAMIESQMCGPLQSQISCMRQQLGNFRSCSWMRDAVAMNFRFAADYFAVVRAIHYNCQD